MLLQHFFLLNILSTFISSECYLCQIDVINTFALVINFFPVILNEKVKKRLLRNFLKTSFRLRFFMWTVSDLIFFLFCINIHSRSVAWKRVSTFGACINVIVCGKIFKILKICRVFLEVTSFVYTNTIILFSLGE